MYVTLLTTLISYVVSVEPHERLLEVLLAEVVLVEVVASCVDGDVGDVGDAGNFGVKDSQPGVGLVEARQVGHLKGKSDKESEKDPVRVRRAPGSEFQMSPSRLL